MGYQTRYSLMVDDHGATLPQCGHVVPPKAKYCQDCGQIVRSVSLEEVAWDVIGKFEDMTHALGTGGKGGGNPDSQWDYEEDMRALSEKLPTVLFTLNGEGEENTDLWRAYFLNGKMQRCEARIEYDEYDPCQMK